MLDLESIGDYAKEIETFCQQTGLDLNHVSYVGTGEHAVSDEPIVTTGLKICSAIAISYNGKNFLVHYCTNTADELVRMIRASFPDETFNSDKMKFHIWHGKICSKVDTNIRVLHQLGLLAATIDFEMLKTLMRENLSNQISQINRMAAYRQSVDYFFTPIQMADMLIDLSKSELYASIVAILEADTIHNVPIDKLALAFKSLHSGHYNENALQKFNACTRGCFSIVNDDEVISTLTVNPTIENRFATSSQLRR